MHDGHVIKFPLCRVFFVVDSTRFWQNIEFSLASNISEKRRKNVNFETIVPSLPCRSSNPSILCYTTSEVCEKNYSHPMMNVVWRCRIPDTSPEVLHVDGTTICSYLRICAANKLIRFTCFTYRSVRAACVLRIHAATAMKWCPVVLLCAFSSFYFLFFCVPFN